MVRPTLRRAVVAGTCAVALACAAPAHAAGSYSAFAFTLGNSEPTIYDFINSATTSLDMTMYELSDSTAVSDLIKRKQAGVKVRVILDGTRTSVNDSAYNALKNAGVGVVWSSSRFVYTHQKTITVDGTESLILSGNLTSQYYPTSRDYGVFDSDSKDVNAIEQVFDADYTDASITPSDGDNLLWSPTDSQSRLLSFINSATKSLDVEEEEFSDSAIVKAIAQKAQEGVTVRVVVEDPSSYASEISEIKNAGGTVVGYSSSTGFYIHAKAMVADYGTSTAAVEVGSMNISSNSLSSNRELGITLHDTGVESVVENAFTSDYDGGTPA
ncbi:phospholipase D-like domain-containing protein [Streptomyces sp. RB6PN25]|uniref:Phospholipase D-like domain-containing protein n=1 Tax=Streptomyces humicola TaxID=2953240 RepID=A0ABT1PSI5_9ACTN|nr:phospholipase D-like domain-containing protein [Streptomyces humicola]MCQ4079522.1 phospholipase D-like domain-containing protein [Streptomyces humicola]